MPVEQKFVQGIHCFWLSVLPILLAVLDKVTGLCRRFLWVGHQPRIAWKTLCLPKQDGGLGLRDGRAWNFALLAKVLWNQWTHFGINGHFYMKNNIVWEMEAKKDFLLSF